MPSGFAPGSARRASSNSSPSCATRPGLGGKAERYRLAAINEMRSLGDRRATAELLLSRDADPVPPWSLNKIDDAGCN